MSRSVYIFLFALTLLQVGCKSTEEEIRSHTWNYSKGYYIGDYLQFDGYLFTLQNDTVLKSGQPVGVVEDLRDRPVNHDKMLLIRSLNREKWGEYVFKDPVRR